MPHQKDIAEIAKNLSMEKKALGTNETATKPSALSVAKPLKALCFYISTKLCTRKKIQDGANYVKKVSVRGRLWFAMLLRYMTGLDTIVQNAVKIL